MKLYTKDQKLQQLLKRQEIQQLLAYFETLEAPVILRELRKQFLNQKHLDKDLEQLIEHGIIARNERRYQLALPILTEYPTTALAERITQRLSQDLSPEQVLMLIAEEYWHDELEKVVAVDFSLPTLNRMENDQFSLVTINQGEALPETLPNYFANSERPLEFSKLSALLGDVQPQFFMDQIGLILERVIAGKTPRRSSIFLDSLNQTQVISENGQLQLPIYSQNLSVDLSLDWNSLEKQTRFFLVRQLAAIALGEQASFSYLKKKKA
ncbi:DUF1803 domain-containing protein [Enterococcus devriesei]|uniref:DUF1803 domain-containing protein n=1 Tax=Enterococcus devriesei TaxID=319970 RepID=UPI0036D37B20